MAVQISSRIGMAQGNLDWQHQSRRKARLIEADKVTRLERFASNRACESLSTVKMQQKNENHEDV